MPGTAFARARRHLGHSPSGARFSPMNNRHEVTGDTPLPQNIMEAVLKYWKRIGVPNLAPHDLRRYAEFRIMPHR